MLNPKSLLMRIALSLALALTLRFSFAQLNTQLYDSYPQYKEMSINTRRFKHNDVMAVLDKLGKDFKVKQVGTSVEGRAIKLVTYGNGPAKVLMWSQMHGDETTATRALLDVFHFLEANDQFKEVRDKIKSGITWYVIPMLNPDGASRFTRRNHYGIDINRDALQLQTPEGRTLKHVRDSVNAEWGFNLHDQGRGSAVEGKPATISLLAPAFNFAQDENETRSDAMQLTKHMFDQITNYIPGQIGIYPSDFEPRAFGDNIQKWGTRTILIESGGLEDDWEKEKIRRLNFVLLLTAMESIASKSYEKTPVKDYYKIPSNSGGRIRELIVKNVTFEGLVRDVAFERTEKDSEDFRNYYAKSYIMDLGDLSTSVAYFNLDAAGYEVLPGKVYEKTLDNMTQLKALDTEKLWKEGYTDFIVKEGFDPYTSNYKFNIHKEKAQANNEMRMGGNPSLVFKKGGKIEYAVVNGVLHAIK